MKAGMQAGRKDPPARLQQWLDAWGFTAAELERAIYAATKSRLRREHLRKIRQGKTANQTTIGLIRRGAEALAARRVGVEELFDFDGEFPAPTAGSV